MVTRPSQLGLLRGVSSQMRTGTEGNLDKPWNFSTRVRASVLTPGWIGGCENQRHSAHWSVVRIGRSIQIPSCNSPRCCIFMSIWQNAWDPMRAQWLGLGGSSCDHSFKSIDRVNRVGDILTNERDCCLEALAFVYGQSPDSLQTEGMLATGHPAPKGVWLQMTGGNM